MDATRSQAEHRHHYLAAMGIDVWVERDRAFGEPSAPEPAAAAEPSSAEPGGGTAAAPAGIPPEAPMAVAAAPEAAAIGRGDARAALDALRASHGASSVGSRDGRSEVPTESVAPPPAAPGLAAPRFRLTALRCGQGLLLLDEALMPEQGRDLLLRLGDLLRAAHARRGDGAVQRIDKQAFFWPQVDAPHVDQSLPRAVEALCAWVSRCTGDGAGFLLLVGSADDDAAGPLQALEDLPIRRVRIDQAFISAPSAEVHRKVWRSLDALAQDGRA